MPLKLWLPLDGTSENRGISGVTMSGSPASWGNGKTGKCAVFNNNTGNVIYNTTTECNYTVEDFSWCIWLKKDYASKTSSYMYAFTVGRADAGGFGYGIWVSSSNNIIAWFGSSTWTVACPDNEWHHFAFTRKGTAIKIYRDGTLITSATFGGTLPTYSDGNGPGIGCFHYTGNIYPLIGAISDFRIYNHTLSAKEVYEISRALIMHYPLCAPGNANPNLLSWSKNYTQNTPYAHTSASKDGYVLLGADSLVQVTPGKVYYLQVKSDGIPHSSHATTDGVVTNKFTVWFYIRNTGSSKPAGTGFDSSRCFTSGDIFINDPDRHLFVWSWRAPTDSQDITLRVNSYSDGTTPVTLNFWDFKVEEDFYSAYVPSRNSAQYTALGYGSNTVRNVTGRGIDLTYSASGYTHVQDSPRYFTAVDFNQAAYLYNDSVPYTLSSFTVSFWVKYRSAASQHFTFGSFNSWPNNGMGIWRDSGSSKWAILFKCDNESNYCDLGDTTYTLNTWVMLTVTWDGTTAKVYHNAELKKTVEYGSSGTCGFKNIYLGNSMFNTHPSSETEEAAMSDFRIYGTALSADDVKYLYVTSAAIDNNGDMFAAAFSETEIKPRIDKKGLVYGKNASESGGTVCAYTITDKGVIDPNRSSWSYTPTTADNSCMAAFYFERIPGVMKYRVTLVLSWSGFTDISTASANFDAYFQGYTVNTSGSSVWAGIGVVNTPLNSQSRPATLAKGAASGTKLYDVEFTLTTEWTNSYKGEYIGIRTNYSNGTGKWTISKVRVCPADEYMVNSASLCSSGAIQARLVDEGHLS